MAVCGGFGGGDGCGGDVNFVLEADPGYERDAESEVEEAFVGDGEDDENR